MNEHVLTHGPLPPVKLFKSGLQTFYSKTKCGVDGVTQFRAVLRSPTSSPDWEHKVAIQTFKTLAINAFQSYRLHYLNLNADGAFICLDDIRKKMNAVESFADFVHKSTSELITYADSMGGVYSPLQSAVSSAASNSTAHEARLIGLQIQRNKRRRFEFFNEGQGKRLRLEIQSHEPILSDSRWCGIAAISP